MCNFQKKFYLKALVLIVFIAFWQKSVLASSSVPEEKISRKRVAVLVNANDAKGRQHLEYADEDVAKISAVLAEFGGFKAADQKILSNPSALELNQALLQVKAQYLRDPARGLSIFICANFKNYGKECFGCSTSCLRY